jgi:propionyl-CoA synthetase
MTYADTFRRSIDDRDGFWLDAAKDIDWYAPPSVGFDATRGWFADGTLNTCHNALDRHADGGRAEQIALIYDSPVTDTVQRFTYGELRDRVAEVAGGLRRLGVGTGDRVVIYMPMIPEAVMTMLACARLGAIHSVVFGGFAAAELAIRIDDARPAAVVAASCGIEPTRVVDYSRLLGQALEIAEHQPDAVVMLQRPDGPGTVEGAIDWDYMLQGADPVGCVPVAADAPLYILYTSGTTGRPKGVVRDNGGHAVALAWSMRNVYDVEPGETYWAASDIGWVVGHSYIVYGPLINGNTTILYEGKPVGTPDPGAFWRVVAEHGVNVLFTAPTAFRAIRREDPDGSHLDRYRLADFRALFLAGERCDPATLAWAEERLGVPVVDHWWQTETGWAICANLLGIERLGVPPGSAGVPVPGWDVRILREDGTECEPDEIGTIVVRLPLPPGALVTLWGDDERFVESYLSEFPGHYYTADAGYRDPDGRVFVMSRTDDVSNVAGHRLSTGAIEEVVAAHPDVAECAVIGVHDELKGQVPLGLVVLTSGHVRDVDEIEEELRRMVRDRIGPVAVFKRVRIVDRLPKTRSGKILRKTMRAIADDMPWSMPATIDDPRILDELGPALRGE